MESQETQPARNRRTQGSFQQIDSFARRPSTEKKWNAAHLQVSAVVLSFIWMPCRQQSWRRETAVGLLGRQVLTLTALFSYFTATFFPPSNSSRHTFLGGDAPPPPPLPALTDLMRVFLRGRGASALKTKHLTFNCFGFTIQRRKVVSPREGNSL